VIEVVAQSPRSAQSGGMNEQEDDRFVDAQGRRWEKLPPIRTGLLGR
jgi:hypothetical protein